MICQGKKALFVTCNLFSATCLALLLAPGAAQAQCAPTPAGTPLAPATASGDIECQPGTYADGIHYESGGDLAVTVHTGSDFGTGGVASTAGSAADDLTLSLTGSGTASTHSFNTAFPVLLDAESDSGNVLVDLEVVRTNNINGPVIAADNAATTRAVRAISTAGGDVTVRNRSAGNEGNFNSRLRATGSAASVAVEARSFGGGDVTVDLGETTSRTLNFGGVVPVEGGAAIGRLYGIAVQAEGDGQVSIVGTGRADDSTPGTAGIHVTAGTGKVTMIDSVGVGHTGVFIDAGGDVEFQGNAFGTAYGIDLANVAAGSVSTLDIVGTRIGGGTAAIRAAGAGDVVVNLAVEDQRQLNFDFTGLANTAQVNVAQDALWRIPDTQTVPDGNFDLTILEGGTMAAGEELGGDANVNVLEDPVIVTFAGSDTVMTNEGTIIVAPRAGTGGSGSRSPRNHEGELRLVDVEFRQNGTILLGAASRGFSTFLTSLKTSDLWYDDILVLEGGTWVGQGGQVVVNLDGTRSQADCTRDPVNHDLGAADCLRIVNGATEGVTNITLLDIFPGDRGRIDPEGIVLVETPGSTSAQGHFVVGPETKGYSPEFGGSLDKGLFQYAIVYDADREQHILHGMMSGSSYQFPMLATAAQNLWRTSTGTWFERQADLRANVEDGIGGGVWLRAVSEEAERDIVHTSTAGGQSFDFDNGHQQSSYAITSGVDLMNGVDDDRAYVFGLMTGYAHADVDYDVSPNTQAMDAWTAGLYASFISGGMYVDAALNFNRVILDNDTPGFNFFPEGSILSSRLNSIGAQVEGGWRIPFEGGLFAEPLASLSYVRSDFDDIEIEPDDIDRPGLTVAYDDPTSFRAGLGGRVGLDSDFGFMRTQVSLLARVWEEFEGENAAVVHNDAFPNDPDITLVDDFSGQITELVLGASVWNARETVSGFVNLGGKFGDDYEATTASVGVRVAW